MYYTFYIRKTDELWCAGRAWELVKQGFFPSESAVYSTVSRVRAGKNKKYMVVVEEDGDGG